jgi:hypothetical protein
MISKVFMICNAYESGFGHGLKKDGLDLSKSPHGDLECGEAYQTGYEEGFERATEAEKAKPLVLDRGELITIANQAFAETVDCDFTGNPITNYDVLLWGAYGPAVARLCNLVLQQYGQSNVFFPEPVDETGVDQAVQKTKRTNGPLANEARNALFALFCEVPESIAQDITTKVYAAFNEIAAR